MLLPVPVLVTPVLTLVLLLVLPVPFGMEREALHPSIVAVALRSTVLRLARLASTTALASCPGILPDALIARCAAYAPRVVRIRLPRSGVIRGVIRIRVPARAQFSTPRFIARFALHSHQKGTSTFLYLTVVRVCVLQSIA